jgi:II/X family phage/plasmid replication protein
MDRLSHPWDSIGSNFGAVAFKVFNDNSCYPCVEIKGSPAKLLQGHNVFGSVDPELCIKEMLLTLLYNNPKLSSFLDFPAAEIREFDVTFSASVPVVLHDPVMSFLKNVSGGQTRSANNNYDSTCYWGAVRSRHGRRKVYLKFEELKNEIKKLSSDKSGRNLHRLSVLSDDKLQDFSRCLLRFEARVKDRVMKRLGIPMTVRNFIKHVSAIGHFEFCQQIWQDRFKDIFSSIEGQTMNVNNDDEVREKLCFLFSKIGKNGKLSYTAADSAFSTYRNLRRYGWVQIRDEMSVRTFYHHVKMICECGISRGFLQNLSGGTPDNVVPLIQLIKVDFSNQYPSWYKEPNSAYSVADGSFLKLVR